jgi:hypothetical protein
VASCSCRPPRARGGASSASGHIVVDWRARRSALAEWSLPPSSARSVTGAIKLPPRKRPRGGFRSMRIQWTRRPGAPRSWCPGLIWQGYAESAVQETGSRWACACALYWRTRSADGRMRCSRAGRSAHARMNGLGMPPQQLLPALAIVRYGAGSSALVYCAASADRAKPKPQRLH